MCDQRDHRERAPARRAAGGRGAAGAQARVHLLAGLEALPVTEPIARVHADIWAGLAERGDLIGAHDLWIAATALTHGLGVATRNAVDFGRVPGLRVVAPEG